jgi:hypothetical protein
MRAAAGWRPGAAAGAKVPAASYAPPRLPRRSAFSERAHLSLAMALKLLTVSAPRPVRALE